MVYTVRRRWGCYLARANGGGEVQSEESGGEADSPGGEGDAVQPLRRLHEPPPRGTANSILDPNLFARIFSLRSFESWI